ncbi:MAG: MFS transporter [Anaerolineaceae bacterium]|nr:MFS transporter [Anaerolineaceae bacterium]
MSEKFYRNRLTWLAYLILALYSYFLNIIGPITPFLKDELKLSYTVSSLHYSAFAVGILVVGLAGHRVIEGLGRWRSIWIGAFGMSLGAVLLMVGKTPVITIGAAFLMGLVGSLILATIPAVISDQYQGEQRSVALSEANTICSLLAISAPLMVGLFARYLNDWGLALGIAAICPIFLWIGFGKIIPPQPTSTQEIKSQSGARLPGRYWMFWFALVLSVAIEFCMISWSADYLENGLGMLKVDAAQAVSLFFAGMVLGRLIASLMVRRFSARSLVTASLLLACVGFLVFWKTNLVLLGLIGLFLTGLGVASLYPLIISLAIDSANGLSTEASSRATLASGAGILILPLILGRLADAAGIRQAYGVVILLFIGNLLLIQFTKNRSPIQQPVIEQITHHTRR